MRKEVAQTKKYYNTHADVWGSRHNDPFFHEKLLTEWLTHVPEKGTILDIGCAHGNHVPFFLGIGRTRKYTGIDISKKLLRTAQRRYPQSTFLEGDISDKHTLPKKKYDACIAIAVLMHVPFSEWDTAFGNLEQLTKPGGYVCITLPVGRTNSVPQDTDTRHFTLLSESEQVTYLKSRKWKIVKKVVVSGSKVEDVWRGYIVQLP